MNESQEMPKIGQFSVLWKVKSGDIFSATLKWVGFVLLSYNSSDDDWEVEHGYSEDFFSRVNASFYTSKDEKK